MGESPVSDLEFISEDGQLCDAVVGLFGLRRDPGGKGACDLGAVIAVPGGEQFGDLLEAQPEVLASSDESEALDGAVVIDPLARRGPCRRNKPDAFVVTEQADVDGVDVVAYVAAGLCAGDHLSQETLVVEECLVHFFARSDGAADGDECAAALLDGCGDEVHEAAPGVRVGERLPTTIDMSPAVLRWRAKTPTSIDRSSWLRLPPPHSPNRHQLRVLPRCE